MSFLGRLFGFLGRLFGSEKALQEVVKSVSHGLDELVHTDEERANAAAAERTEARKMVIQWMAATQGQNLSRRLIALSIAGVWLFMKLSAVAIGIVNVYANDDRILQVIEITKDSHSEMNPAVMLIISFYFAAPHMGEIAKAFTKGKS